MNDIEKYRQELNKIDSNIVNNFVSRMEVINKIAEYKKNNNIPILDKERENQIINSLLNNVPLEYTDYFKKVYKSILDVSKLYQSSYIENPIVVSTQLGDYCINIGHGLISDLNKYIDLDCKVLIISDDGVPHEYVDSVLSQCKNGFSYILPHGEKSKGKEYIYAIVEYMFNNCFDRNDCVIALGGGVVTDISGFVASIYKRGVNLFSIPTTLLAMIDSSVGGKNGINYNGYKNQIGTFFQPSKIIIDINTLDTLPERHFSNGLIEALKMGMTHDKDLFSIIKSGNEKTKIDELIYKSIMVKKRVVECDLFDENLRKSLNFGHTIGHALEGIDNFSYLLHGECVAVGMMVMTSQKNRLVLNKIYDRLNIPKIDITMINEITDYICRDKKINGKIIREIFVDEIGSYKFIDIKVSDYKEFLLK